MNRTTPGAAPPSARASFRWAHALATLATMALGLACSPASPPPPAGPAPAEQACVDGDDDGFGPGCDLGTDCDDTNAAFTTECLCDGSTIPGCPCETQSQMEACGYVTIQIGAQTICGMGYSTCDQGQWGPCIINNAAQTSQGASTVPAGSTFGDT
jgi:hypothetical protein